MFDGTHEGPACPGLGGKNIMEDCLRVNVYTTKVSFFNVIRILVEKGIKLLTGQLCRSQLPSVNDPVKRSVLVFFHYGGYYMYSGQSFIFGPEYLLDKDIVLVTVNYRLATLGMSLSISLLLV